MHFYELHEGDDELYTDVLLAREEEMPPDDFFELVQGIRKHVQGHHEEDTLIEAIAVELERNYAFLFITDERVTAAVNVSTDEDENFLIATEDEFSALGLSNADYRSAFAEYVDEDADGGAGSD